MDRIRPEICAVIRSGPAGGVFSLGTASACPPLRAAIGHFTVSDF